MHSQWNVVASVTHVCTRAWCGYRIPPWAEHRQSRKACVRRLVAALTCIHASINILLRTGAFTLFTLSSGSRLDWRIHFNRNMASCNHFSNHKTFTSQDHV